MDASMYLLLLLLLYFIECYLYVKQNTSSNDNTTASLKSPCYASFDGSNPRLRFEYYKPFWITDGWFIDIHILSECDSNNLVFVNSIKNANMFWGYLNQPIELTEVGERFYVS